MEKTVWGEQEEEKEVEYDEAGDRVIKGRELTLQEKLQFQAIKKLHRQNMTKEQVVKGKVFKGASFISKPDRIVFKDFTVGQTHTQTIQLTNVSNAFNSFNILPLNETVRNFFEIEHIPQGKISPGLSCSVTIKFTPLNNEDIEDEFCILAETGRIGYPIICTSKKSIVVSPEPSLHFGDVIFGEKSTKELILQNSGALATEFEIKILTNPSIAQDPNCILKFEREGKIEGNSQLKVPFELFPQQISKGDERLQINFKNFKHSPPILINTTWSCIDLPIYIQKEVYDCELVLPKHIYRRKLVFHNRSKNTMKINIHQNSDTKDFFEFNPTMGYIQGNSQFQIWMKITLEKSPEVYLKSYSQGDGVFEVEFKAMGSDQLMPVPFRTRFKLTSDVVRIDPDIIQFGNVYQGSGSKRTVSFENTGQLLQEVLLYPVPKCISVEQNKYSFKILPKETRDITLILQPEPLTGARSRKDDGQLCFKIISGSLSTQDRRIKYQAMILRKEIDISKSKLEFPTIQVEERYENSLEIKNVTNKEMQFQVFVPPFEVAGLSIMPLVGKLKSSQSCQLFIQYLSQHRQLTYDLLQQMTQPKSVPKEQIEIPQPVETNKKQVKKQPKKEPKLTKQQLQQQQIQRKQKQQQYAIRLQRQRQEKEAKLSTFNSAKELQRYGGRFVKFQDSGVFIYYWTIPIYYKFRGDINQSSRTTFIEIVTTSTGKKLNVSESVIDFQHVVVGTRLTKSVLISSLNPKQQQLYKNQLSAFSGFSVVNALRTVSQDKRFNLVVEFTPYEQQPFKQTLRIHTETGSINCELRGRGIRPEVSLTPENGILALGGVIVDESVEKTFKLKNLTEFDITFNLRTMREGISNKDNITSITYTPKEGVIEGNKQIEVKVRFRPDRVSDQYYNLINIEIPEQKNPKSIYLFGYSYPKQAYISIFKPLKLYTPTDLSETIQYAYDRLSISDTDKVFSPSNNKLTLTFPKAQKGKEPTEDCFKQKIVIGSCKVMDSKLEKPVSFDVIIPKDDKFGVDVAKGSVAAGTETVVTFTYKPPEMDKLIESIGVFQDVGQWKEIKVDLKVAGGFVKPGVVDAVTYQITLRAYVNQI